ncbi:hypothetical protein QCA50_020118 [Cerrena zonata]|uniref:Urea transporter n=1 Tax=Cerrena zonata TaxID=2478898 RepID=A0AAW0F8H8_9APHY
MFLFMIGELSAIRAAIETLTGLNALAAVIVEVVVTSIYTSIGGFRVSFITDNFQGAFVLVLVVVCIIGMATNIDIDTSKIGPSGLLKGNKLGFWLRTFASKSNKDLWIGCSIASFVTFTICFFAIKVADDILQIYLIADLVSAAIIPAVFLGLSDTLFYFLRGFDVMCGGLGALLGVFIFGTVYYGSAKEGGKLLLVWNGIYNSADWGPFGAFVIAPFGGILITFAAAAIRITFAYLLCKSTNRPFTALDRPEYIEPEQQLNVFNESYGSVDDIAKKNTNDP